MIYGPNTEAVQSIIDRIRARTSHGERCHQHEGEGYGEKTGHAACKRPRPDSGHAGLAQLHHMSGSLPEVAGVFLNGLSRATGY